ncbi:hypothetical protein [Stenotrophomonas sp. SAM-B]|uniref:hypothetical protein n=1 Tax=Stenotrophomonas sp. SAM-B TaxID=2729141 RepID=UPI0019D64B01|nr:hypothetical protein [Stenotrophomonas sp. SAM-B]
MYLANVVVPCFTVGNGCHPDWTAISAIGGWLGAAAAVGAALVALRLAGGEREKREAQQAAANKFAMIALWPRLHRAQGDLGGIGRAIDKDGDAPETGARGNLLVLIESLEAELKVISALGVSLDTAPAERLAAAVSIAGYVARQARRIAAPENATMLQMVWYTPAVRKSWAEDARTAVWQLLRFASEAEKVVNAVSGRIAPSYSDGK